MNFLMVIGLALALAMDALAVSLATGLSLRPVTAGQTFRLAFHFGLFQFLMPIAGWAAGETFVKFVAGYDHWLAFGLLLAVGGHMIVGSFLPEKPAGARRRDPTRGLPLVVLSVATSLDALAVGLSFAALRTPILYPALVIGLVAFGLTAAGMRLGPLLGKAIGRRAELVGGLILIFIGVKILLDHLNQ